jgi:uncharacterized Zn finger protein
MSRWDYFEPSKPRVVKDGIKTKRERGEIGETWWSKRWLAVLESFGMGSRLTRGRTYARKGQVISLEVTVGQVTAKVQGSQPKPYKVKIQLKPLSNQQWEQTVEAMAKQAIFAAKLLAGEMPQNIEEAFKAAKVALFPTALDDLETDCTCPDWANPCKHVAAVYYLLAERFDEDPYLLFTLRGRTQAELIASLRDKRIAELPTEEETLPLEFNPLEAENVLPLEEYLDSFWVAGAELERFSVQFSAPEVDNAILKRLGEAPFGDAKLLDNLAKTYQTVSQAALKMSLS